MTDSVKPTRSISGRVISDKMDKTVTVLIERKIPHPLYKKYIKRSSKMHVHDEENSCKIGDLITIVQGKPVSKSKSWQLLNIVERAS